MYVLGSRSYMDKIFKFLSFEKCKKFAHALKITCTTYIVLTANPFKNVSLPYWISKTVHAYKVYSLHNEIEVKL